MPATDNTPELDSIAALDREDVAYLAAQDAQRQAERIRLADKPESSYPSIRRLLDYLDTIRPLDQRVTVAGLAGESLTHADRRAATR